MLQLKRFNYQARKISRDVEFPEYLSFAPFEKHPVNPPHRYELTGVVEHLGGSLGSGHYVSFVKSGNRWYSVGELANSVQRLICVPHQLEQCQRIRGIHDGILADRTKR